MKILIMILIPIVFFLIIGGSSFYFLKKANFFTTPEQKEAAAGTVQEFIPLATIENSMLKMKDGSIAMVIDCGSTNYNHLSAEEQDAEELIYQNYINSINFPKQTFIQTRKMDHTRRCEYMRENIEKSVATFPALAEFAEESYAAMERLNEEIGNSQQKKKYEIVYFDEDIKVEGLSEHERLIYIEKELQRRYDTVIAGLATLQIPAYVLNDEGLNDLVYSTFHRDGYGYASSITNGDALSTFVDGYKSGLNGYKQPHLIGVNLLSLINSIEIFGDSFMGDKEAVLKTLRKIHSENFE